MVFDLPLLYDLLNKPNPVNDKTVDNIIYFPNIPKKYLNLLPNMTLPAEGGWVQKLFFMKLPTLLKREKFKSRKGIFLD